MSEGRRDPAGQEEQGYRLVPADHFALQIWLFRGAVVLLAYLCAVLGCWLIKGSARPFLEALAPACGVLLGFALLRWMEVRHAQHAD